MPEGGPAAPGARVAVPPLVVLAVGALGWWTFNHAPRPVAERVIYLYGASLVLGPGVVYAWMRGRGASGRAATLGAAAIPLAWLVKEGFRLTANFSVLEAVYYAFNPMAQGLYAAIAVQLALVEIVVRRRRLGLWRPLWAPALALGVAVLHAVFVRWYAARYGAAELFYSYIALHARLFGES